MGVDKTHISYTQIHTDTQLDFQYSIWLGLFLRTPPPHIHCWISIFFSSHLHTLHCRRSMFPFYYFGHKIRIFTLVCTGSNSGLIKAPQKPFSKFPHHITQNFRLVWCGVAHRVDAANTDENEILTDKLTKSCSEYNPIESNWIESNRHRNHFLWLILLISKWNWNERTTRTEWECTKQCRFQLSGAWFREKKLSFLVIFLVVYTLTYTHEKIWMYVHNIKNHFIYNVIHH